MKAMETHCVSCKKSTATKISSVRRTKQNKAQFASSCAICSEKKSTFIKNSRSKWIIKQIRDQNSMNLL